MSQVYKSVFFMYQVELSPGELRSGFSAERRNDNGEIEPTGWVLTLLDNGMFRVDSGTSGKNRYVVDVPREAIKNAKPYLEEAAAKPPVRGGGK